SPRGGRTSGSRTTAREEEPLDVVHEREEREEHEPEPADHRGRLAEARGDGPPDDRLDHQERELTAVEERDGQEVQDAEVHADDRHEREELLRALGRGVARREKYVERAADLVSAHAA